VIGSNKRKATITDVPAMGSDERATSINYARDNSKINFKLYSPESGLIDLKTEDEVLWKNREIKKITLFR